MLGTASTTLLDRFLGLDTPMYAGPGDVTLDYADKMLLAALQEAQSVARSYDSKAQIVGALNLVLRFGELLPIHVPDRAAVLCGRLGDRHHADPAVRSGSLSEPDSRRKGVRRKDIVWSKPAPVYYVDPDCFADVRDLARQALRTDWTSVLGAELLKTSRVRIIKQARFRRGLMMTAVSFIVLGGEQFFRSLAIA